MDRDEVYCECIDRYGGDAQVDMMIEEASELIKALLKYRRAVSKTPKNPTDLSFGEAIDGIIDELADVKIMVRQMEILYGVGTRVEERIDFKVNRQIERLGGHNE